MSYYTSLHAHSLYSILDGHALIPDYVQRLKAQGHTHAALTDHGVMSGLPALWKECQDAEITPIAGLEAYVTSVPLADQVEEKVRDAHHLTLLAINERGYQNLIAMSSYGQLHGFYFVPRIDHAMLAQHSEGIVLLTGCGSSETSKAILSGDMQRLKNLLRFYHEHFPGRYFLELQEHGNDFPQQRIINKELLLQASRHNLPCVATNDSHFCTQDDYRGYKNLMGVRIKGDVDLGSRHTWVRDNATMASLFEPEWLANTLAIADMVEPYTLGTETPKLPISPWEDGNYTPQSILETRVQLGLMRVLGVESWADVDLAYVARMEHELDVIAQMGAQLGVPFERYFLNIGAMAEFIRESGIRFSTRGSAAGSLVCWTLGISALDPIQNGLVFERFLNPFRVSLPDIDLDVADNRRDDILLWLQAEYGTDHIARIGSYNRLGPKQVIKDAARLVADQLQRDYLEISAELNDLIPHSANPGELTLAKVLSDPDSVLAARTDPDAKLVLETAMTFADRLRGQGIHAAGVVIADRPVTEIVPLMRVSKAETAILKSQTQYEMEPLEKIGLIKFDLLGLSELAKMEATIQLIHDQYGITVDLDHLDWTDEQVWDAICSGNTLGLFQLAGRGMTRALTSVNPRTMEELSMVLAMYRPGPMANIETIVARKEGREPVASIHPSLDEILRNTYGIPVYQEQLIEIVVVVAGFSRGEADLIRKAMGKKKPEDMIKYGKEFKERGLANGYTLAEIEAIWSYILPFAEYGFNKSHSMAYAYEAYKSAWLKTYYPQVFYAAAMTVEQRSGASKGETTQQKIGRFIQEAKRHGISVLPPAILSPTVDFMPEGHAIRYGLSAILLVGEEAAKQICAERPTTLVELIQRCPVATKRDIDALIASGAIPGPRTTMKSRLPELLKIRTKGKPKPRKNESDVEARARGMARMAGLFAEAAQYDVTAIPDDPIVQAQEELKHLGMIHSDFPTIAIPGTKISELPAHVNVPVSFVALLSSLTPMISRSKREYAKATLMDETGVVDVVIWPGSWHQLKFGLKVNTLVYGYGKPRVDLEWEHLPDPPLSALQIMVDELTTIAPEKAIPSKTSDSLALSIPDEASPVEVLAQLTECFKLAYDHPGNNPFTLSYFGEKREFAVDLFAIGALQGVM